MKKLLTALAACLLTSVSASATELDLRNTTYGYFQKEATPGFRGIFNPVGLDYLKIDVTNVGDVPLDFHFYGWGGIERSKGNKESDLSYAYLAYRFPRANGIIKGGRFYIFDGVAMEQINGASMGADLAGGFGASIFAGEPVNYSGDTKGDVIYGGKLSYRYPKILSLGISALREEKTPTGVFEGTSGLDTSSNNRDLVGWDAWFSPHSAVEFISNGSYDASTRGLGDAKLLVNFRPAKAVTFSGEYNVYYLRHYFSSVTRQGGSQAENRLEPFLFTPEGENAKVERIGGSFDWRIAKPVTLTGIYRHIENDRNGNADRFAGILRIQGGGGWGSLQYARLNGSRDDNSYHQMYVAAGASGKVVEGNVSLLYQVFDEPIYDKKHELEAIGYLGFKLAQGLVLSGELQFGQGPRYEHDLRGLVRLSYTLMAASKGAAK